MKRFLALVLTVILALCCATSLAETSETLYGRILTLLDEGDETIGYGGLGIYVTMDGADYPAGLVTARLVTSTGLIRIENGENFALWEHISQANMANTLLVLCGRWSKLTEDMSDSFQIIFSEQDGNDENGITFTTAEEASAFVNAIYQQSAQQ